MSSYAYYELVVCIATNWSSEKVLCNFNFRYVLLASMCAVKIAQNRFCAILIFATRAVDK